MKTLKKFKKIFALGLSLSLLGSTIFGAHAVNLGDYPKPFIIDGTPSSNLAVVVGDNSAASDVVGMGDIISGLQASAVSEKELPQYNPKVEIDTSTEGVGNTGNMLEINETIGSVKDLYSEADLEILQGGTLTSVKGITKYSQYLKFNSTSNYNSTKVIFTEDNFLDLNHFFYVADGETLFDWELHFEDGFTSSTSNPARSDAALSDLHFRDINILGQKYTVVNTFIDTNVAASGANSADSNHSIKIEMLGGGVNGRLTGGQEETFYFGDKAYKITATIISSGGSLFNVNGKDLPPMKIGQYEVLEDGIIFGIRNIIENSFNIAEFTLGGNKLAFIDNDASDDVYTQPGVEVNGELIDRGKIKIKGKLNDKRTEFELQNINYRLAAEVTTGGQILVPSGHGVREYLKEPEGMLSPGWDIRYEGLTDTGTTLIKLHSSGQDEYKLEFTNEEGLNYQIPAFTMRNATVRPGQGSGNYHQMLWTVESPNSVFYPIKEKDYFVLSDLEIAQTKPGAGLLGTSLPANFGCAVPVRSATRSSGANTRILQYVSRNNSAQPDYITLRDLATGNKQVKINTTANPMDFQIILGGKNYQGFLNNTAGNLSIDLDRNGTIGRGTGGDAGAEQLYGNAWIVTQGGAILFINTSTNTSNSGSIDVPRVGMGVDGGSAGGGRAAGGASQTGTTTLGNSSCLTVTILSNKFDEQQASESRQHHLNFSIPIIGKRVGAQNYIGFSMNNYGSNVQHNWGFLNLSLFNLTTNPTLIKQLDTYGGLWEIHDPANNDFPEEVTYEFPLIQRGPKITIGGQEIEVELSEQGPEIIISEQIKELPVGISKLASEIKNIQRHNAIIVGGPCANKWASELMNNPQPCHESIPEGEALIQLYEHPNGNVALLVAGRDAIDTRRGARALQAEKIKQAGNVKIAKVTGISLTDVVVRPIV